MRIEMDHRQPRIARDRIGIALTASPLAGEPSSRVGTWVCPVTGCLTLRPAPMDEEFKTSTAGIYAKLSLADFGSPGGWIEGDSSGTNAVKLFYHPSGGTLSTSGTFAANTPFAVLIHNYGDPSDDRVIAEGAWSLTPGVEDDTAFRLKANGNVGIWRGGVFVVEGNVNLPPKAISTLMFIPCRGRELVIVGSNGSGFRAIFQDIEENEASPIITPAAAFHVTTFGSTAVLPTPIRYPTTGTALSLPYSLGEAPDGSDVREIYERPAWMGGGTTDVRVYASSSYRGSPDVEGEVVALGGGAFAPNGANRDVRVLTTLTGDGYSSPYVTGAKAGWRGTIEYTPNAVAEVEGTPASGVDVTAFVLEGTTITVPASGPAQLNIVLAMARRDDDATLTQLSSILDRPETIVNRPVRVFLTDDGPCVFDGVTGVPMLDEASQPEASTIGIECLDLEAEVEAYVFSEPLVLDGYRVCRASDPSAVQAVLRRTLPDDRMDLEDADAIFDDLPPGDADEFTATADTNESAGDVLERFVTEGLGLWHRGFRPQAEGDPVYEVVSPETILARPAFCTLYGTIAAALTGGYATPREGVWREMRKYIAPAEANVINVVGWDPRTGEPLRAVKRDDPARDPTLAPDERPSNWLGSTRKYGLASRGLIGRESTDQGAEIMFPRVTVVRRIIEFGCDLPMTDGLPLWRGDRIEIDGTGIFAVTSLRIELRRDVAAGDEETPTGGPMRVFRARVTATDVPARTGGVTGDEIAENLWRDPRRGGIVRRRSGSLTIRSSEIVSVL